MASITQQEIRRALAVVLGKPEAESAPVTTATALRELDKAAADETLPLPRELRHFLRQRSYEKAWTCLQSTGTHPPSSP